MLIVMAGLPGSGKSAVARELGERLPAVVVAVDPIDDALRRAGIAAGQPTGLAAYLAAEVMAQELLRSGLHVVIDAVNAVVPARMQWRGLAAAAGVDRLVVEVVCSDPRLHRSRLAARCRGLVKLPEPVWADVVSRQAEYVPWDEPVLTLDSVEDLSENVARVLTACRHGG